MPTISGVWKWNDTLPFAEGSGTSENITYTSNNAQYTVLSVHDSGYDPRGRSVLEYGTGNTVYNATSGWTNEAYKTIDFGSSPQEISQDFYDYLTANATQQSTPTTVKAVSSANLAEFKAKCDETYAKVGEGGITLSQVIAREETLPTATADSPDFVQTPDGTLYRKKAVEGGVAGVLTETTIKGVFKIDSNPYIIDVRFDVPLNFSSNNTNFTAISADSTRGTTLKLMYGSTTVYNGTWTDTAYQTVNFGDVEQSFDSISWFYDYFRQVASPVSPSVSYEYVAQQDIPTPTTADNGKVLGVANGAYALQAAGGGGTKLYCHRLTFGTESNIYHVINNSETKIETLQNLTANELYIVGRLNVDTTYYPVVGFFNGVLVYITFTGGWQGITGANFAIKEIEDGTKITDYVTEL